MKLTDEQKDGLMVWVDLEMTGLNPVDDMILEVGFRLTDWNGDEEYARFTSLVHSPGWRERLGLGENRPAFEIHSANGLIADLESAREQVTHTGIDTIPDVRETESMVLDWLTQHDVPHGLSLAGSSNHLDRYFLLRHMPQLANQFGYRLLDMSAIRESLRIANPPLAERYAEWREGRVDAHRVQEDIDASIDQWQWFIDNYLMI